jgi:NAD(P)-dependent dehydrogenase (short-subunit alcohol dehydrogenase family)
MINLWSTTFCTKWMVDRPKPRAAVVNLSAVAGQTPLHIAPIFSAGKSYVDFFTQAAALEPSKAANCSIDFLSMRVGALGDKALPE